MKKHYITPLAMVVNLHSQQSLLAGSNSPTQIGNGLIWNEPGTTEEFLSDEEIA
jgi:hypothetical protein